MKKLLLALLATTTGIMSGCSFSPTREEANHLDPNHSMAYNILQAGGIDDLNKFKEPRIPYKEYKRIEDKRHQFIKNSNAASWVASSTINNIAGSSLSSFGVGLGLGFLSSLTAGLPAYQKTRIVFWMPKNLAKNEDEANLVMTNMIIKAYKPSWTKYPHKLVAKKFLFGAIGYMGYFKAPGCGKDETNCDVVYKRSGNPIDFNIESGSVPDFINTKHSRESVWVGNEDHIEFYRPFCRGEDESNPEEAEKCGEFNLSVMPSFIKNLPDWAYVYYEGTVFQGGMKNFYPYALPIKTKK